MYDWPEVASANDALWRFLSRHLIARGIAAPPALSRGQPHHLAWHRPDLLLAQTCGYPFATQLRGKVRIVGTPCYGVPGCQGSSYSSVIVASRASGIASLADLAAATAAINSAHSQSGHWALRAAIALTPGAVPPKRAVMSGGHRQSLAMLSAGAADVAAIDAVCWALARRHEPAAAANTRVIAMSPMAPGLPLISGPATPPSTVVALREAWHAALASQDLADARQSLFLSAFDELPATAYEAILGLERAALRVAFPPLELDPVSAPRP